MEYLKISNKGELAIKLVGLMGGTTKSDDQFKIGQFGTGLKYTIAYLVRNNISFKIFIGEREVDIQVKKETIRDTDFKIVYIDGERTSLTSSMGMEWEAWMIIRELWCNALDEQDPEREVTTNLQGKEGHTTFYIQNTGDISEVVDNWTEYFLHDIEPIQESYRGAIYTARGKGLRLYKNGVLILKDEKRDQALYSYDIKNATINEMREYRGSINYDIPRLIADLDEKQAIYLMDNVKGKYEENLDFEYLWGTQFSSGWKEAIGDAKIIDQKSFDDLKSRGVITDEDAPSLIVLPKCLFKPLSEQFENISAVRVSRELSSFFEVPDREAEQRVKEGITILETCGYEIDPELEFVYGIFGNKLTLAQINISEKLIMVSERMKGESLFEVVTMLVEENEHYKTGHKDCSREFQQHFINLFTKGILEKNNVKL